jgi:hypothetical protein
MVSDGRTNCGVEESWRLRSQLGLIQVLFRSRGN